MQQEILKWNSQCCDVGIYKNMIESRGSGKKKSGELIIVLAGY